MAQVNGTDVSSSSGSKNNTAWLAYVESHNAEITAKINTLNDKKEAYERVSSKASSISNELSNISTSASSVDSTLENLVIGGEPIGTGNFKNIGANIGEMASTFSDIVNVCNIKIDEINLNIDSLKSQYL